MSFNQRLSFLPMITILIGILFLTCQSSEEALISDSLIEGKLGHQIDSTLSPYVRTLMNRTDNASAIAIGVTKVALETFYSWLL